MAYGQMTPARPTLAGGLDPYQYMRQMQSRQGMGMGGAAPTGGGGMGAPGMMQPAMNPMAGGMPGMGMQPGAPAAMGGNPQAMQQLIQQMLQQRMQGGGMQGMPAMRPMQQGSLSQAFDPRAFQQQMQQQQAARFAQQQAALGAPAAAAVQPPIGQKPVQKLLQQDPRIPAMWQRMMAMSAGGD